MKHIHFPACGYGFWYYLPKLFEVIESGEEYSLTGASAGSLICIISLLKKEYQNFNSIMRIAKDVRNNLRQPVNLYTLVEYFIDRLIELFDKDNLEKNLKKINIQISVLKFTQFYLDKLIVNPIDIDDLKNACLASCYIPGLSRVFPYYCIYYKGYRCLDGGFCEYDKYFEINDHVHIGFRIPDEKFCKDLYNRGYATTNLNNAKLEEIKDKIMDIKSTGSYIDSSNSFNSFYSLLKPLDWLETRNCFGIANFIARDRPDLVDIGTRYAVQINLFLRTILEYDGHHLVEKVGNELGCFALTESNAGVLSGLIVDTTFNEFDDKYIIDTGEISKKWVSQGLIAKYGLLIAKNINNKRDYRIFFMDMDHKCVKKNRLKVSKVESLDVATVNINKMEIPKEWCLKKTINLKRGELLDGIFYGRVMISQVVMNSMLGFVSYVKNNIIKIKKFNEEPLKTTHLNYLIKLEKDLSNFCKKLYENTDDILSNKNILKINCYKNLLYGNNNKNL